MGNVMGTIIGKVVGNIMGRVMGNIIEQPDGQRCGDLFDKDREGKWAAN